MMFVAYKLNEGDVELINHTRNSKSVSGNSVNAGDVYPAVIVKEWNPNSANLRVFLDGNDSPYWATSRVRGLGHGNWDPSEEALRAVTDPYPTTANALNG